MRKRPQFDPRKAPPAPPWQQDIGVRAVPPRHIESALQRGVIAFFNAAVAPGDALLFAVPNGERRDPITAARLSGPPRPWLQGADTDDERGLLQLARPGGEGVLPGAADLVLLLPGGRLVLIELKRPKSAHGRPGRQSPMQKAFAFVAGRLGHDYRVVTTLDEFGAVLEGAGVRLRVRTGGMMFPR